MPAARRVCWLRCLLIGVPADWGACWSVCLLIGVSVRWGGCRWREYWSGRLLVGSSTVRRAIDRYFRSVDAGCWLGEGLARSFCAHCKANTVFCGLYAGDVQTEAILAGTKMVWLLSWRAGFVILRDWCSRVKWLWGTVLPFKRLRQLSVRVA